ncbi:MAG: D-alanine--D-alanine ligase [Elusimicrobiota bacterium]|jgi:D-alanine-D-alanine ligase|nr:D-alanine--D-alanine ligase [Elusimicrobiota bacterium]
MLISELKNKKIGVLCGGMSTEKEISLKSGKAVLNSLKQMGFKAVAIKVDKNAAQHIKQSKIDIAFPVLHGVYGEDGAVQGMLEIMGIPYVGCGIFASAASMDKDITKKLLKTAKLNTPDWFSLKQFQEIPQIKKYPVVVKPANGGSTIGITVAKTYAAFLKAAKNAFKYDKKIIVEEFVKGKEITVAVCGGQVLPIIEIVPKGGFYDYKAKYQKGCASHIIPARISKKSEQTAKKYAAKVYELFDCRAICRVDMIVDMTEKVWILENNTMPGMTETSLVPDAAKAAGLSFNDLVLRLLEHL